MYVGQLVVPPLDLMLTTRKLTHECCRCRRACWCLRALWWLTMTITTVISLTLSEQSSALHAWSHLATSLNLDLAFGTIDSNVDLIALTFSLHSPPSPRLSSFFCCWWGAHPRSRSFHHWISKILDSMVLLLRCVFEYQKYSIFEGFVGSGLSRKEVPTSSVGLGGGTDSPRRVGGWYWLHP